MATVSKIDVEYYRLGREHISVFLSRMAERLKDRHGRLLEIGPQNRTEVHEYFRNFLVESLDLDETWSPTYVGDITKPNHAIPAATFDCVVCMDVIEHTLDPFGAVREMHRLLKPGGDLLLSSPLNFRIHGPLPDCWRFTEHGLKVLLRRWDIIEIDILESPGRNLFPIHYNVLARKPVHEDLEDRPLTFRFID